MLRDPYPDVEPLQTFDLNLTEDPSHELVLAVAEESDTDPLELDPLHDAVDGEALDSLFAANDSTRGITPLTVEFDYLDYRIVLDADGTGRLYDRR